MSSIAHSAKRIRVGVIGLSTTGWAAGMLIPPLLKAPLSELYELRAVCTSKQSSAEASAAKFSTPVKAYWDTQAICADADLDLIVVACPAHLLFKTALMAVRNGKDIYVECPVIANAEEGKVLKALIEEKGVKAMFGWQGMHGNVFKKVKEIIDNGEIGEVLSTTVTSRTWGPNAHWGPNIVAGKEYALLKENGITLLTGVAAEFLGVFLPILGPVASLSSTLIAKPFTAKVVAVDGTPTGATAPGDAPTQVAFTGILKSGAALSMHWRAGMGSPADTKSAVPLLWVIDGTKGSIRMESQQAMACWVEISQPEVWVNGEKLDVAPQFTQVVAAWEAFAKGGKYFSIDDVIEVARVVDAVEKSNTEGRRIDVQAM